MRIIPRRLTCLILLLGVAPRGGRAQTLFRTDYPFLPTVQRQVVHRRIQSILAPTLTFPALVRHGGRFDILLRPPRGPEDGPLPPPPVAAWRVHLRRQGAGPAFRCPVRELIEGPERVLHLRAEVPVELARDVYELRVMGPGVDDRQPSAVRIVGASPADGFRFAVLSDHQLWDPSYRLSGREHNSGGYPRQGEVPNLSMARQGLDELALWDPDFVLHLGDLTFGLDYEREYDQGYELLRRSGLALFAVPGNHDAYASYVVRLRGGALRLIGGVLGCRKHLAGELSWGKAWVFITCLYGDVKHLLYADLHRDGLVHWRRQLGPATYAFDHGAFRFVGLNTYDGSPERRHAFSIFLDAFDLRLGVPAVDNYGGTLTVAQLDFLRGQVQGALAAGKTVVVFGHHDPRGGSEPRYHANEPFPTDPLSLGGFEEWNYDSAAWDSDPADGRPVETPARNSGVALLEILARSGGYYLSGHVHHDERRVYPPGSTLGPFTVKRRLEFIRTTTASSSAREEGYSGYRLIEARGGQLTAVDYAPEHGLGSIPGGNLWREARGGTTQREVALFSGLPRTARVSLSLDLPSRREGYRFRLGEVSPTEAGGGAERGGRPEVREVMIAGGMTTYKIAVRLTAASWPPSAPGLVRRVLRALPARDNAPPVPRIAVSAPAGEAASSAAEPALGVVGQPLLLSAEGSTDAQGDRIVAYLWDLGEGWGARGPRVVHRYGGPGARTIRLTLIDEAGAVSSATREVVIRHPPRPGCGGCGLPRGGWSAAAAGALLPLALLIIARWRRRRQ